MRKITVTNNREIGGTNTALQKVAFMSCKKADDIFEINTMILKNGTKDIYLPSPKSTSSLTKPFLQCLVMRTHSASAEPTVQSEYCRVVGSLLSGTVRFTVLAINDEAPSEFAVTIINKE